MKRKRIGRREGGRRKKEKFFNKSLLSIKLL